jgi:hypothetical protein
MALTVATPTKVGVIGDLKYTFVTITWDNSYPTGGLALTPGQVGLTQVLGVQGFGTGGAASTALVEVSYDTTNSKLQAFGADGAAAGIANLKEIPNATNIATITTNCLFVGK